MDCHPEPVIEHYWDTSIQSPRREALCTAISKDRWEQINRYFHIWKPTEPTEPTEPTLPTEPTSLASPDQKAEYVANCLRTSFAKYWHPNANIAVDECIESFTGRSSDTVNIPSKPTPKGFKIWCLADDGYVIDFLWHQKGDKKDQGPQGLRQDWQNLGFTKT
jgi:Transposase IS4